MKAHSFIIPCAALSLLMGQAGAATELFNGKNFDGWKKVNGPANYEIIDGAIVGTTHPTTKQNTFLVYDKQFSDFILEFEFKMDDTLNSGVQFRSHCRGNKPTGRFCGYQFEMDPSDRAWSAGIYDEGGAGWLYTTIGNPMAMQAFIHGGWNKARIEAIGDHIRTWINGVPACDLIANKGRKGYIGLQVHHPYRPDQVEGKVAWRNITIEENVKKYATPYTRALPQVNAIPNTISPLEKKDGWKLLWDGKSTKGWRGAKLDTFPKKGWKMHNGRLSVLPSNGAESTNGGDIITTEKYKNFELSVDFRFSSGANSGIKYFVDPELNKGAGSAIGCEFQILDDGKHPDAKLGKDGNRKIGSLYDLIPAPSDKRVRNHEFNNARIIVKGNHVEHWLNEIKTLEYERNTPEWETLVKGSKYKDWPNFGNAQEGHILLQDHGNAVEFMNIKIKEL